jgi:colanic acid biosynthesis protein WcaH
MTIEKAVEFLDKSIPDKRVGLPDDIFYFISRTTPMVNVDLLVRDSKGRVLLSWRDDIYSGSGWHVPGGIIRYKETFSERIQKTAEKELGVRVDHSPAPIKVVELMLPEHENRGHFISLLYKCSVPDDFIPNNEGKSDHTPGYLMWHDACPDNLIKHHNCYREFMQPYGKVPR